MASLFIDDERNPKTNRDWIVIRSYKEAIRYMETQGLPDYISFDHDLGEGERTGYDIAKWIEYSVSYRLINWNPAFKFNVHSANPVGGKNIQCRLDNFITHMDVNTKKLQLKAMYGGIWKHNVRDGTLTDVTTDMMFLLEDV